MKTRIRRACLCFLGVLAAFSALGQDPADLTARDKTEIFIRHIVRLSGLEPERYRALILEYEIASALEEFGHEAAPGAESDRAHELCLGELLGGFVERALAELYPQYRKIGELRARGQTEEARQVATELCSHSDPYVASHARLAQAEMSFEKASTSADREALEAVIQACEGICSRDRLYLVRDFRACQLIALCYERLKKPLFELLQYAILLVDYNDIPKDVEAAVKERIAALAREVNWPLSTVADWMREVERYLREALTAAEPTQRQEAEIVYALDKLIQLQEARERKACPSCGSSSCRGGCQGRPTGNRSSSPARVSALPKAPKGEILLRGVSRGDASTIWGQLKAKEAARALQAFKGKLPPHYQRLLEKYYENLSKME